MCRTCMPARYRSYKTEIKFPGGEYRAEKGFKLGYACSVLWCHEHRPDVTVWKGNTLIGSVELPCCPELLCKLQVDCYKGEARDESTKLYTIKKCCCNCHVLFGKICGCCVESASELEFEIHGNGSGHLEKKHNGVVNECCNMADKYKFEYPTGNADEQAIFLAAI